MSFVVVSLRQICPTTKDKCLSFVVGQIFSELDKFFQSWTNFCQTSHICLYETTTKDKNCRIFLLKNSNNRKLAFSHTKWVKILLNSSKLTSLCKVRSWDPSNVTLLHEKARQMKKTFCFNFCAYHCLWKNVSKSDLRCPQLPRLKKGNLGNISQPRPVHFSASAFGLGLKNLSSVPFFIPW